MELEQVADPRKSSPRLRLSAEDLRILLTRLDDVGLGVAMRLIETSLHLEGPVPDKPDAIRRYGIDPKVLRSRRASLKSVLILDEHGWSHEAVNRSIEERDQQDAGIMLLPRTNQETPPPSRGDEDVRSASPGSAPPSATPPAPPSAVPSSSSSAHDGAPALPASSHATSAARPSRARQPKLDLGDVNPASLSGELDDLTSLYVSGRNAIIELMRRRGVKESNAYAQIGALHRQYDENTLVGAFNFVLSKKDTTNAPLAMLRTFLADYPTKEEKARLAEGRRARGKRDKKSSVHVTPTGAKPQLPMEPKYLGMSEGLAAQIAARNAENLRRKSFFKDGLAPQTPTYTAADDASAPPADLRDLDHVA